MTDPALSRVNTALYLEDLRVGQRFGSGTHALDEAQIKAFARQFDPIWCELTKDDHRWLREKLDEEDDGDGAFGRMVADYDSRSRGNGLGDPGGGDPARDSMGS